MILTACLIAIAAGLLNPVQSGLTAALQRAVEQPFAVAAISLGVSLACALVGVLQGGPAPSLGAAVARAPWWSLLAGFAGFGILIARPLSAPALGSAAFTGLTLTAGVVGSIVLDHWGWLGFEQHAASFGRIAGAMLMVVGAALVCLL